MMLRSRTGGNAAPGVSQARKPLIFQVKDTLLENPRATALIERIFKVDLDGIGRDDLALVVGNLRRDLRITLTRLAHDDKKRVREFIEGLPPHRLNGETQNELVKFLEFIETCMEAAIKKDPSVHQAGPDHPWINAAMSASVRVTAAHYVGHVLYEAYNEGLPTEKKGEVEILPVALKTVAKDVTGVDLHPMATVGEGFFIDHGIGTVIGATSEIGNNVVMFHGITLGTAVVPWKSKAGERRHPRLENNVQVFSDAKIFGPITIGAGSIIGATTITTRDRPPNSRVLALGVTERTDDFVAYTKQVAEAETAVFAGK